MMLIKNISVSKGLCNGTRVQILSLGSNIIICRYINGPRAGDEFLLHRHRFKYGGKGRQAKKYGAVKWTRLQFPLRPGFVMTMHKSQGSFTYMIFLYIYFYKGKRLNASAFCSDPQAALPMASFTSPYPECAIVLVFEFSPKTPNIK